MDSPDLSPSMADFLEKEQMFYDEHKNTDVDSTSLMKLQSTISAQDQTRCSSDEDIGSLLQQMKQLLSPRDLEFLKAHEGKDVDELLKETEEFIQRSSPLFRNLSTQSSCTESSSGMATSPTKLDEQQEDLEELMNKMADVATVTANILDLDAAVPNDADIYTNESRSTSHRNSIDALISPDNINEFITSNKDEIIETESVQTEKDILIDDDYKERDMVEEDIMINYDSHSERSEDPLEHVIHSTNFDIVASPEILDNNQNINLLVDENFSLINDDIIIEDNNRAIITDQLFTPSPRDKLFLSDLEVPNLVNSSPVNTPDIIALNNNNNIENQDLKLALQETEIKYQFQLKSLEKKYEEEINKLKTQINDLNIKLAEYESCESGGVTEGGDNKGVGASSAYYRSQIKELKSEIENQEQLIAGYQRENQKLFQEISSSKEQWKKEKLELEENIRAASKLDSKNLALQDKLKDAEEQIVKYKLELEKYKEKVWKEKTELEEKINITSALENKTLALQKQLKSAQETIVKCQLELENYKIEKVNNDLVKLQEDTVQLNTQSDQSVEIDSLKITITQLQAALNVERTQKKNLARDKDLLLRENVDLKRQVKEVEGIIKRRNQSESNFIKNVDESRLKEMEKELQTRQAALNSMQSQLEDMQEKYNDHINELENRLKSNQKENNLLRQQLNDLNQKAVGVIKMDNKATSVSDSAEMSCERPYSQAMFQEDREADLALLRMENKSLREEIQRLGQDMVTLHNKRIQDLRALQSEHEQEIRRLLNDYSNRHSQSTVAELQGQIYTQQMVITHLKEQLKQITDLKEENALLKLERDHLEKALMNANKRIQELQTPESQQYQNLLEKFENLERRHEVREQKLQSIVRDLLARSSEPVPCGPVCRNKLLDKNREICYYRVEMDKILEALREFRRSK